MQKTLIILKPDTVSRSLIGTIICRLEQKGLKLVGSKFTVLSKEILEEHYSHIKDKPFFGDVVSFMTSTPVLLQVREGTEAVAVVRKILGVTNSREAQPGTIRGDYGISVGRNLMHASEDERAAKTEVERFFTHNEIFSYTKCSDDVIVENNEK